MAIREISISNSFVQAVVRHSDKAGLSAEQLLREAGIAPDLLFLPNARIPVAQFARLCAITMRALDDEFMGYGKDRLRYGTWRNMCYATLHTTNLGHALARYCRFYQMFDSDIQPFLISNNDEFRIEFRASDPNYPYEFYAWESMLFNLHRYASWLTRQHIPLISVNVSYEEPAYAKEYRHLFLGNPVAFKQDKTALVLPPSLGKLPVTQTEGGLRRMLRHPNLILMAQQYRQRSFSAQVRKLLSQSIQTTPSISDIADRLHLHQQTLRRRLADEGTSFNEIKAQCRRDTALYYLGRSTLSIEEIAFKTGFSETSAFTRAFKDWTGVAPQKYRRRG